MSQVPISPIPSITSSQVRFQGAFQGANVGLLLKQAPLGQRLLGNVVKMREGTHGLSHLTFIQDNLVVLIPKTLMSRSKVELSEVSLLEVLESLLIYYGVPLAGGKLFKHLSARMAQQKGNAAFSQQLSTSLAKLSKELPKDKLAHVVATKASIILATIGLLVFGGEYAVNYAKNIFTSKVFKKERFSDVINLSQGQTPENQEKSQVTEKAKRRLVQSISAGVVTIAGAMLLARFGGRSKLLQKPLQKFVKALDFNFAENGSYRLSKGQMILFMGLSVGAYLDASRDKLERVEVAARLGLVMSYLIFGQEALEKLLLKSFGKKYQDVMKNGRMKSMQTLADEAMSRAKAKLGKADKQTLIQEAARQMKDPLKVKNMMFMIPLAVGIFGTGFGLALMNRFWTAKRFKQQEKEQAAEKAVSSELQSSQSMQAPPVALSMPNRPMAFNVNTAAHQTFPGFGAPISAIPQDNMATPHSFQSPFTPPAPTLAQTRPFSPTSSRVGNLAATP